MKRMGEFPRRGNFDELQTCTACTGKRNAKVARERIRKRAERVKELVAAMHAQHANAPHISELCDSMLAQFGGLEGFAASWKEQIDEAVDKNPGSKTVLDQYYAVAKLIGMSTAYRATAKDIAAMTDDEIDAERERLIPALLKYLPNEDEPDAA